MAIEDEFLKPPLIHFSKANRQFPSGYKLRAALHTVGWHQERGKLSRSTKLNAIAAHLRQELEGAEDSEERPRKIAKGEKSLIMANINQGNEEMEQPVQNGEEGHPLGGDEGHQPERNHRRGQACRLAPNSQCASMLSCVRLFATLWTIACQAPLSMGFSRQDHWSGLPGSPPGDLPDPRIKPMSLCLLNWQEGSLSLVPPGQPDGPYPIGRSTMGWVEMEMIWKSSWKR